MFGGRGGSNWNTQVCGGMVVVMGGGLGCFPPSGFGPQVRGDAVRFVARREPNHRRTWGPCGGVGGVRPGTLA